MDAEEIQKRLLALSQRNFRRVVALVLKRVLNYDSINVDGILGCCGQFTPEFANQP